MMRWMIPFLACAAAILMPSCISWDIGGHLKGRQTTYTGVDIAHPVDGKLYRPARGQESCFYVTAPEVTYTYTYPAMLNGYGMQVVMPAASNVQPTGRIITARIEPASHSYVGAQHEARALSVMPGGLCAEESGPTEHATPCPAVLGWEREEPSLARRALIGTCDYVVDPLLNIVTPPVELVCYTAAIPFFCIYELFRADSQCVSGSAPDSAHASAQ